jgi:Integrase zinc binding domain
MTSTLVVTELASIPDMMVREDAHHFRRGDTACFPQHVTEYMTQAAIMATEVAPVALLIDEIIREQVTDPDCQQFAASAGADSLFNYEDSSVLVRRAPLDGSLQIVVQKSLQPRVLHLEHFPRTAGHSGVTRMFRTLRKRFFWKICLPTFRKRFVNATHARGTGSRKEPGPVT